MFPLACSGRVFLFASVFTFASHELSPIVLWLELLLEGVLEAAACERDGGG